MESSLIVRGICHPPPKTDEDYRGWSIRRDEMKSVFSEYVGKPACVEHGKRVGTVKEVYADKKDGSVVADLRLDDTSEGWEVLRGVNDGTYTGFSIAFDAQGDTKTGGRVGRPIPKEISLVKVPAMKGADIFAFAARGPGKSTIGLRPESRNYKTDRSAPQIQTSLYQAKYSATLNKRMNQEETKTVVVESDVKTYPPDVQAAIEHFQKHKEAERQQNIELVTKKIHPLWQKMTVTDSVVEPIANVGDAFEVMLADERLLPVVKMAASIAENYQRLEANYTALKEKESAMAKAQAVAQKTETALNTREERKKPILEGVADLFNASIQNSGVQTEAQDTKRVKISDMFGADIDALMARATQKLIQSE